MSQQGLSDAKRPLLKELEFVAKQSWRLILGGAAIGFVLAAMSLQGVQYFYPVTMQVTTAQTTTGGGGSLRGGTSQLSGLASLANISLPSTQNEIQFQLFLESLYSRDVADAMAKNQDILITLYGDQWDSTSQTWREPPAGFTTNIRNMLRSVLGLAPQRPWHAPDGENLQGFLNDTIVVTTDPRKPYIATIKMSSSSREFATRFLNLLVQTADERLRQKALDRAQVYISYLTGKLGTVTVSEHRDAITQSLSEQERYAMVASAGGKPFAAEVFQTPWGSNLPDWPSPRQSYILYLLLGAGMGLGLGFLRYRAKNRDVTWVRRLPAFIRKPLHI